RRVLFRSAVGERVVRCGAAGPGRDVRLGSAFPWPQYHCPQRYHLVTTYFVPRVTGLPAWRVKGLGEPASSALFQTNSSPGRGLTATLSRGKSVSPPSSTAFR